MNQVDFSALYEKAKAAAGKRALTAYTDAGSVAAAILTQKGNSMTKAKA